MNPSYSSWDCICIIRHFEEKNFFRPIFHHKSSKHVQLWSLGPFLEKFLPLKVPRGDPLIIKGKCQFSKMKNKILRKSANFGQKSKSKTILESEKDSASDGQKKFLKKLKKNFFLQKNDFSLLVIWSKSTPQMCFFLVHRLIGHTQTNILRVISWKNEIIKFFRKWEKRKSDLNFSFEAQGPPNPNLGGSKYFLPSKYFWGTPFLEFWPLKVSKLSY